MSELGRLLAEARTAKELSLAQVEAATRIRQKYLAALESGNYDVLPRGTVARGFLRTYASYLNLDVAEVMRRYADESGDVGAEVPIAEPGKPRLVDYRPIEVALVDGPGRASWWRWLVALVIVAAAGAAGWWFLNANPNWNPLPALGPQPSPTSTATPTRWVITVTLPPPPTFVPSPTATSDLLPLPIPTAQPTATPTPRPTATPEVVTQISVVMRISQRAWVEVTVDGNKVVTGELLEAGEERSFDARQSLVIRTGNAGGVVLSLNGQNLGAMGRIGEVVERSWVAEQGQVIEAAPRTLTPSPSPTPRATPAG